MITILLPSRKRPHSCFKAIKSAIDNCVNKNDIEILIKLDTCDPTIETYYEFFSGYNVNFIVSDRLRGYRDFNVFVNDLCSRANGEYLFLFNDDALISTYGWDERIRSIDSSTPKVIRFNDNPVATVVLFPIITKALYNIIGHFSLSTHCDTWVQDIANATGIMVNINDIKIIHDRCADTGNNNDDTFKETSSVYSISSPEYYSADMSNLRNIDIHKVNKFLGK